MEPDLDANVGYDSKGSAFSIPTALMDGKGSSGPWPYMAVGAAARLGGAISQSTAIAAQGAFQASRERTNAQLATMSSHDALAQGDFQANQIRKATAGKVAKITAGAGAQGVTAGSVAPLANQENELGAIDAMQAKANAYKRAFGFDTEALQHKTTAGLAEVSSKAEANNTLLTGGLQAMQGALQDYMTYDRGANMGRMSMGRG